jgi:hypothetical protein
MRAAIGLLSLLLPLEARAQPIELTLNCQYETVLDATTRRTSESSGSFSATVRMQTLNDGTSNAVIEATTELCQHFVGSFTELVVGGECHNAIDVSGTTIYSSLFVDRISGSFDHSLVTGTQPSKPATSIHLYSGHCKPGKKLF